jgi:hypothetical protein
MSMGEGLMPPLYEELEYMVASERGQQAAAAVRALIYERHPTHMHPMYIRFIAGDQAFLSPCHMRDSVSLSIGGDATGDYWPVFRDVHHLLVNDFAARAHWGRTT